MKSCIINLSTLTLFRVNTFRRPDLLKYFLMYYKNCDVVQQVQIVWSDQSNDAPVSWNDEFSLSRAKFVFEIHSNDSLSNRFRSTIPLLTEVLI